eukprot:1158358-Pelagomonas_calceolata.AAC.2
MQSSTYGCKRANAACAVACTESHDSTYSLVRLLIDVLLVWLALVAAKREGEAGKYSLQTKEGVLTVFVFCVSKQARTSLPQPHCTRIDSARWQGSKDRGRWSRISSIDELVALALGGLGMYACAGSACPRPKSKLLPEQCRSMRKTYGGRESTPYLEGGETRSERRHMPPSPEGNKEAGGPRKERPLSLPGSSCPAIQCALKLVTA